MSKVEAEEVSVVLMAVQLAVEAKGGGGGKGGSKGSGAPGGWLSTTGNPSGGDRGNAPPSK